CNGNEFPGLIGVDGERLFDVDVAAGFKTGFRDTEVTLWRSGYVDHVRLGLTQHIFQIAEPGFDRKALGHLPRHERLAIAHANHLTAFDPLQLLCMIVGNFPTSDDANLKHGRSPCGKPRSAAAKLLSPALRGATQGDSSAWSCCTASSSTKPARHFGCTPAAIAPGTSGNRLPSTGTAGNSRCGGRRST